MRGQPELLVSCDGEGCKATEVIALHATARGNYSEDHVDGELRSRGWMVDGDRDLCEDCARLAEDGEEEWQSNLRQSA